MKPMLWVWVSQGSQILYPHLCPWKLPLPIPAQVSKSLTITTHNLATSTISLGQQTYIEQILHHFGLENPRAAMTPMEVGLDLTPLN